jgi:hypothetical protein
MNDKSSKSKNQTNDKAQKHHGSARTSPYPTSRLAPGFDLVDLAKSIAAADDTIQSHTSNKLKMIAKQIKSLQEEARGVLQQAHEDQQLHRAKCNFQRLAGHIYHLYCKADGQLYFSMLSADDWGGSPPDEYRGAYRLENDMSWTPAEELESEDEQNEMINQFLLGLEKDNE